MKKYLYFVLLIALSLMACIATFVQLAGGQLSAALITFSINFPICLLLCIVYYQVISRLSRIPFFQRHRARHILVDWSSATAIGASLSLLGHSLLGSSSNNLTVTLTFLLWNSTVVLGVELYVYHCSVLEKEMQLARLQKEKAAYQFEALKQQINPHFLFNSLNALASLAYQDAEKTNHFAKKLSSVYRYLLLTADKPWVTLREELTFLDAYLFLEKIRFDQALQISLDIPDSLLSKKIVPTSLQMLVENALKHNISTEDCPLSIRISAHDHQLSVCNNLQPRAEVVSSKKGLTNLRRLYEACNEDIQITKSDHQFLVTLSLL